MEIAILSRYYNHNLRGVETFVGELASRLPTYGHLVSIYPDTASIVGNPRVLISTNGRLDVLRAKIYCVNHGTKLIIPGQSGLGFDDRLNLFTFPDAFVALTMAQQVWASHTNPLAKIVVIPNGVDLSTFQPQAHPTNTILSVGALEPDKRLDLLIKAASDTQAKLILVGQGSQKSYLTSLAQKYLPNRFEIANYSHTDMPGVYNRASVFAYPTVPWESFGIAMLEAMACGLPVVATSDPIRREIVGNAGLYIDPADTPKFSQALTKALNTNWSDLPRNQAKKYGWDQIALQYDQLIRKLCSQ